MSYDQQRLLAGHLLRRIGFGPSPTDVSAVIDQGWDNYIASQIAPPAQVDSATEARFIAAPAGATDTQGWQRRWYSRMLYSPWQLQEKMTLLLHEHFATSNTKVANSVFMHDQEEFLRSKALGNFRDLLIGISVDKAMLVYLDNNNNNGAARDSQGNPITPNLNFARELLQLFALGTTKLDRYGNPLLDSSGTPVPAYTEADIKAVARALTGWYIKTTTDAVTGIVTYQVLFNPSRHDTGNKLIFGVTITGQTGDAGRNELPQVIDLILSQSTHSRFIAKILIQKLATETPSPDYINYVGQVYTSNGFDLKYTVQAILAYPDFTDEAIVRNQYRTPIEQFIGALRSLKASFASNSTDNIILTWTRKAAHQIYYPPSVFSFYPPGEKAVLVNTALTTYRDQAANAFVTSASVNFTTLVPQSGLTPTIAVDYLSDILLYAPLDATVRTQVISYMAGSISLTKLRGAAWLILCSPDFQRN